MSDTKDHAWRRARLPVRLVQALGVALLFAVLVTANSGGYRYGVSDQAFYVPAVQHALSPDLFPRDAAVMDAQARVLVFDDAIAWVSRVTGAGLPALFLGAYLLTVALFATGLLSIGTALYRHSWTVVALVLAATLRHRITETGVNTFEGYFHPRVLAFALGLLAVGAFLRDRRVPAAVLVAAALLVHPTTALWFAIWLGTAVAVSWPGRRLALAGGVAVAALALSLSWMGAAGSLRAMDPPWLAALDEKDYLFADDWPIGAWLVNAIAAVVLVVIYRVRQRRGLVSLAERTVFLGCVALLGVFALSLPLVDARVALAVQLQVSRVLWPVELMATAYLCWALAESGGRRPGVTQSWRAAALVTVLLLASGARGAYILYAEQSRPLIAPEPPATAWQQTADWVRANTPPDAHFLVDPGHAWKYGRSFRVAAERDVLLEEVKDGAMAIYSRDVALRVRERAGAIGDFSTLTEARVSALAREYDLDYLISRRSFAFPLVFARDGFHVYSIPHLPKAG